jgi:hypothetical protein
MQQSQRYRSRLRRGFLGLGPDVEYAKHSHEAEEVYIALICGTLRASGDKNWTIQPLGVPIRITTRIRHGFACGLCAWRLNRFALRGA